MTQLAKRYEIVGSGTISGLTINNGRGVRRLGKPRNNLAQQRNSNATRDLSDIYIPAYIPIYVISRHPPKVFDFSPVVPYRGGPFFF